MMQPVPTVDTATATSDVIHDDVLDPKDLQLVSFALSSAVAPKRENTPNTDYNNSKPLRVHVKA